MVEAFVLITCEESHEEKIIEELTGINEILTTNRVKGPVQYTCQDKRRNIRHNNKNNYIRNQDN